MPLTRSAARRSHRALASDDVLSTVFSFITPEAGFGAATASKTLRDAWRRAAEGCCACIASESENSSIAITA